MVRTVHILVLLVFCLSLSAQEGLKALDIRTWGADSFIEGEDEVSMDRPGVGTSTTVLKKGHIQWESGISWSKVSDEHFLTLPTTLFRFGVCDRVEIRLEYEGELQLGGPWEYSPAPLYAGTKIKLLGEETTSQHRWLPKMSAMFNLGLPLSAAMAQSLPVSPQVDLLFENDIMPWFYIGYSIGAHWDEWRPAPDVFASLALNFDPHEHVTLFIESYNTFDCGNDPLVFGNSTLYDVNLDFGISAMVHPRIQIDLFAGFNCYNSLAALSQPKNNAHAGAGVAWLLWYPR